jgi:D-tyrosyl-tRNA(Tyr) deacylase
MRVVIQRVSQAQVIVGQEVVGQIGQGLLVLLGVAVGDTTADAEWLANKLVGLRLFADDYGRMNLSVEEVNGSILVVSQFTLLGDCQKGRRPSFIGAAPPVVAEALYKEFILALRRRGLPVAAGRFGAMMQVKLINDGPVTLILDSPSSAKSPFSSERR